MYLKTTVFTFGLKDYNDLNKVDTDNISFFIDYTTMDK